MISFTSRTTVPLIGLLSWWLKQVKSPIPVAVVVFLGSHTPEVELTDYAPSFFLNILGYETLT